MNIFLVQLACENVEMLPVHPCVQTNDRVRLRCELDGVHSEVTLSGAVFRLTDLSQAAVLTSSLPYSPEGFRMDPQARALLRQPQLFNTDGTPVRNDPTYQAPEVSSAVQGYAWQVFNTVLCVASFAAAAEEQRLWQHRQQQQQQRWQAMPPAAVNASHWQCTLALTDGAAAQAPLLMLCSFACMCRRFLAGQTTWLLPTICGSLAA